MKPTYSIDRKAPRMRKSQFSKLVITKELWEKFIKSNGEYANMGWREFYENWLEIAKTIREQAIQNPLGVKLEKFTGELKLQYLPYKMEATNHSLSTEIGYKVNHLNIENKGKVAKIKWERRWAVKFNKMLQFYAFDETRELNKMAKQHIDKNPNSIRTARSTLGGFSAWRTKRK